MAPKGHIVMQRVAAHALGRVDPRRRRAAPAGRREERVDLAGDRGGLGVDLDERLGAGGGAADEDALGARLGGAVLAVEDVDEAVVVALDAERLREAFRTRRPAPCRC